MDAHFFAKKIIIRTPKAYNKFLTRIRVIININVQSALADIEVWTTYNSISFPHNFDITTHYPNNIIDIKHYSGCACRHDVIK